MAIYILTGKPGSGKSYYALYHLLHKFFYWDKVLREWLPKTDIGIITNIEEIKINTFSLGEMVKAAGGVDKFFTVDYQKVLLKRWLRLVYVIDEAGEFFPKNLRDDKIIFLFQYHRHLGLDFYLICPSEENISRDVQRLSEYFINARPRSGSIGRGFVYDKIYGGEKAGAVSVPKRQDVFRLYKSMEVSESSRIGSFTIRYGVIAVIAIIVSVFGFMGAIKYMTRHSTGFLGAKKGSVSQPVVKKEEVKVLNKIENLEPSSSQVLGTPSPFISNREGLIKKEVGGFGDEFYERVFVIKGVDGKDIVYSNSGIIENFNWFKDNVFLNGGQPYVPRRRVRGGGGAPAASHAEVLKDSKDLKRPLFLTPPQAGSSGLGKAIEREIRK